MNASLRLAQQYLKAGLVPIPICSDGSKAPLVKWREYQEREPTKRELSEWFPETTPIAIVCGQISDNLEVLDFDCAKAYKMWRKEVDHSLLKSLPRVRSGSGGYHVYYRCSLIETSQVLARGRDRKALIETRGSGGYIIAPSGRCTAHPTGERYRPIKGPKLTEDVPEISIAQRETLFKEARSLGRATETDSPSIPTTRRRNTTNKLRRGRSSTLKNRFNDFASWESVLVPEGWVPNQHGDWTRPGKNPREGTSARVYERDLGEYIEVFSTDAPPFSQHSKNSFTKFDVLCLLRFGGSRFDTESYLQSNTWEEFE